MGRSGCVGRQRTAGPIARGGSVRHRCAFRRRRGYGRDFAGRCVVRARCRTRRFGAPAEPHRRQILPARTAHAADGRDRCGRESAARGLAQAGRPAVERESHARPTRKNRRLARPAAVEAGHRWSKRSHCRHEGAARTLDERKPRRSAQERAATHQGIHQGGRTDSALAGRQPRPHRRGSQSSSASQGTGPDRQSHGKPGAKNS